MLGKVVGREKRQPAVKWTDLIIVAMSSPLENMKERLGTDHHRKHLSMWLLTNNNLMAQNQSIVKEWAASFAHVFILK